MTDNMDPLLSAPNFEPPSSPPCPNPTQSRNLSPRQASAGTKERRNPSVTPRKFRRFFTPRSHGAISSARQALQEITQPNLKRNGVQSSPLPPFQGIGGLDSSGMFTRDIKRRKMLHTPEPTPEHARGGSNEQVHNSIQQGAYIPSSPCERALHFIDEEDELLPTTPTWGPPERIVPFADRGLAGQLLNLSIQGSSGTGRQHHVYPVEDWRDHTSSFCSKPKDIHVNMSLVDPNRTIPFCTAACNTNTLIAAGDEQGRVRLLESGEDSRPSFKDVFLSFHVHNNAIIDMQFSKDDSLLVTGSADMSARVVDMTTQTTISILGEHLASLKQVRFQPGANNKNILATSSRDGSIEIWDLRCSGHKGPKYSVYNPIGHATRSSTKNMHYAEPFNSIIDAHKPLLEPKAKIKELHAAREGGVSVTALEFLPEGREHLLLSACEGNSSVRLWDIRSVQTYRKAPTPLSYTKQPDSHTKYRLFGISSLCVSGDGSRFYSVCKDNTVYAYSTAHLILGQAPELSPTSQPERLPQSTHEGIGPLYGFRHSKFHANTFYVKSAIRPAKDGKCELLAVGSTGGSPILFPTDEKFIPKLQAFQSSETPSTAWRRRKSKRKAGLGSLLLRDDDIPISTKGTALVRAHAREVGPLAWSSEGELITVSDDKTIRVWREGEMARNLRVGGETGGRRWGHGWAEVDAEYDEEEV